MMRTPHLSFLILRNPLRRIADLSQERSTFATSIVSSHSISRKVVNPAMETSFYRRKLPEPPAISFSSPEGRRLFREALADGTMECFFPLIEQFKTQHHPNFCALGSLAMVLNALAIDPKRTWMGHYRWFDESMIDCNDPIELVKERGLTFSKMASMVECNGAETDYLLHADELNRNRFREHLMNVCTNTNNGFMIVNYSRKAFLQDGDGHHSPVGGFHRISDSVLILDVSRFKYPPHWVPLSLLWSGMRDYVDSETGRCRGFMILNVKHAPEFPPVFRLNTELQTWRPAFQSMLALTQGALPNPDQFVSKLISFKPSTLINWSSGLQMVADKEKRAEEVASLHKESKSSNSNMDTHQDKYNDKPEESKVTNIPCPLSEEHVALRDCVLTAIRNTRTYQSIVASRAFDVLDSSNTIYLPPSDRDPEDRAGEDTELSLADEQVLATVWYYVMIGGKRGSDEFLSPPLDSLPDPLRKEIYSLRKQLILLSSSR